MAKRRSKPAKKGQSGSFAWMIILPAFLGVCGLGYIIISELTRSRPETASAPATATAPSTAVATGVVPSPTPSPSPPQWNWHNDQDGLFEFEMPGTAETVKQETQFTSSRHINSIQLKPASYTVAFLKKKNDPQMTDDERWGRIHDFLRDVVNVSSSQEITQGGRRCLESFAVFKRSGNRVRLRDFSVDGQGVSMMVITSDSNLDLKSADYERFFNSIKFPANRPQ